MSYDNSIPEFTAVEGSVDRSTARVMLELTPVVIRAPRSPFRTFFCKRSSAFRVSTAAQNLRRWSSWEQHVG